MKSYRLLQVWDMDDNQFQLRMDCDTDRLWLYVCIPMEQRWAFGPSSEKNLHAKYPIFGILGEIYQLELETENVIEESGNVWLGFRTAFKMPPVFARCVPIHQAITAYLTGEGDRLDAAFGDVAPKPNHFLKEE